VKRLKRFHKLVKNKLESVRKSEKKYTEAPVEKEISAKEEQQENVDYDPLY
jgi:hypothetical protein